MSRDQAHVMDCQVLKQLPAGDDPWSPERWIVANPGGRSIIAAADSYLQSEEGLNRSFILFNGLPFATIDQKCPTCTGILQLGYTDKGQINEWLVHIRESVGDEILIDDTSISHFFPVLNLLEPDLYLLGLIEYTPSYFDDRSNTLVPFTDRYGKRLEGLAYGAPDRPQILCPSQPRSKLSEVVVTDYMTQIMEGARPVGLALFLGGVLSLLLDGHHKAQAYHNWDLTVPCLTFARLKYHGGNRPASELTFANVSGYYGGYGRSCWGDSGNLLDGTGISEDKIPQSIRDALKEAYRVFRPRISRELAMHYSHLIATSPRCGTDRVPQDY